jgi:hypothetical protein
MKLRRDRDLKTVNTPVIDITHKPRDKTGWILNNNYAEFVLMHTYEIKFFCMLGYTYLHGAKLFGGPNAKTFSKDTSTVYKFVLMILKCTGGGYVQAVNKLLSVFFWLGV